MVAAGMMGEEIARLGLVAEALGELRAPRLDAVARFFLLRDDALDRAQIDSVENGSK